MKPTPTPNFTQKPGEHIARPADARGWEKMTFETLTRVLDDPTRWRTRQSTIEAVMYSVRMRGRAALAEPNNVERLSRCDDAALAEIKRRTAAWETRKTRT